MILLDTHVWVWWAQGDKRLLDAVASKLDAMPAQSIGLSAISIWEVAFLTKRGRIVLPVPAEEWLADVSSDPRLKIFPITADVAMRAALLPDIHKDPADRFLIAQALVGAHVLVTEDARIHGYKEIVVIRPDELGK